MPEKFNPDSFAPFLETIKRSESKGPRVPPSISVLQILCAAPGGQMDAAALLAASDVAVEAFANTVKQLETAGLVANRTLAGGRQVFIVSPMGEQIAGVNP